MKLRIGRIVIAAIAAEILGVLALVVLVMIFGPTQGAAAQTYAEQLGFWVGPISGFVLCLLGGYWVASGITHNAVQNGLAMGAAGAMVDITITLVLGAQFQPIFAVSNAGRIIAGTIGGCLARRRDLAVA